MKHLTFKTVFLLALGSGKHRSEIHAWQTKILDTNPMGQRCPRIHYPAFYPRISWPSGSRQYGPSGYNIPGSHLGIDPSSLTGPFLRLEHCATIWTGPQTSSRIKRWFFVSFKKGSDKDICLYLLLDQTTVILCYELSDQEAHSLHQVKTHDVRVLAAPMVFQSGASLDLILSACH